MSKMKGIYQNKKTSRILGVTILRGVKRHQQAGKRFWIIIEHATSRKTAQFIRIFRFLGVVLVCQVILLPVAFTLRGS